jgi:predicted dehydrogenase
MSSKATEYGLSKLVHSRSVEAPILSYLPPRPRGPLPKVGLIGAGGIAEYHLRAYQKLGLEVIMICDADVNRAASRREEFYPGAAVTADYREILRSEEITVVDVAVHPEHRVEILDAAIQARKHVLSQKPFALDLDVAQRLIALAERHEVKLAVNQNGRWAPHFAYARQAVGAGLLGEIGSVDFHLAFDHSWTVGTPFEKIHHLLLYDFGVHWFDMASCLLGPRKIHSVFASVARTAYQKARPPFLASVIIDAEAAQVRMAFNAAVVQGQMDRTLIAGALGTLESIGPSLSDQQMILTTSAGRAVPELSGTWFENGFQGTMAELLCAIEDNREPMNSARDNLKTLELCFAALHSANTGQPVVPGKIRQLPTR